MLSAIDGLQKATISKSFADYQDDWLLRRGVERGIEIISEASRTIPTVIQALRPEIQGYVPSATSYVTNITTLLMKYFGTSLSTSCRV